MLHKIILIIVINITIKGLKILNKFNLYYDSAITTSHTLLQCKMNDNLITDDVAKSG